MTANLENQQWPQDWKRSVFISIPKNGNVKEYSNYHIIALISHASNIMLKILQARLASTVHEPITSRFTIWISNRQKNCAQIILPTLTEMSTVSLTMLKSLCGLQQIVKNSYRERSTRPLYMAPEKPAEG